VHDVIAHLPYFQWIKSKVLSMRIKSRSDIGSMDNLESVVRQNFKGHGVPDRFADTVSCTDVVIEDGVVASSSVVFNCTVLLSVAFQGTRVWLYFGLSCNNGVQVDSWECWLPFACRAQRMSTQMSSDSWDQAFRDSGDN
jgi:hypothetical protein